MIITIINNNHLIHLGPQHLFLVVALRHQDLQDVEQTPEGLLLVKEKEGNGSDPVESLAVLQLRVVETVG